MWGFQLLSACFSEGKMETGGEKDLERKKIETLHKAYSSLRESRPGPKVMQMRIKQEEYQSKN